MNPEQQRIAIAEACGWRECWINQNGEPCGWGFLGALHYSQPIPDYLNDLNAMHEAEKVLVNKRKALGSYDLYVQVLLDFFGSGVSYIASQRAEAFLRTIGKWEDAK